MDFPDDIDQEKLSEAALAILSLGIWQDDPEVRAWKGMDWDLLAVLHERGWIENPVGKQKSVVLTPEGLAASKLFLSKHFEV